ncbi:hypothetical protein BJF79_46110 [Actinomadura sp. CNU-125]|uniref:DUF4132 domain-containing protein n=1 Tax=Actinomadura sp. CNU-125 TaxID=1904961 RepID=UPI0009682F68|nr:DUF4132 domain-containing protein [Actinomadura sp. CNU-125]OLT22921.1 hypothetical protein BJF79_46110 [Actinomadura sp. CNU-125]
MTAVRTPAFLAVPPWDRPVKPVVTGLKPPAGRRFSLGNGVLDTDLLIETHQFPEPEDPDWDDLLGRYPARMPRILRTRFLLHAPEDIVRPLLAAWTKPLEADQTGRWPITLVAKYGLDAFPYAWTQAVEGRSGLDGRLLVPYLDAAVAEVMAGWALHGGWARTWLDLHGLDVVPYLAPAALGRGTAARRAAEAALRLLADGHGADTAPAAYPDAADELRTVLSAHPLRTGAVPRPKLPAWAAPAALPKVLLRGGEAALPPAATRTLAELLATPVPCAADETRAELDPASLAEFGWALFEGWRAAGEPDGEAWALVQLGRTGDDTTARRLVPVIAAWPRFAGHRESKRALAALAAIGTDASLRALRAVSADPKYRGLVFDAASVFRDAAAARGLAPEELADRLVPDLGLDADASTTFDYGSRRFLVRLDDRLRPQVTGEDGKPRKSLPKPSAKDDPDLAPAAHRAFTELKKHVLDVLDERRRGLETAMVDGRTWTPGEFRDLFVRHPIVYRIARRLLWRADAGAFRIAEDGTFADVRDDPFVLPEAARIGIAHPVHLAGALPAWREVFGDYELLQPFPQLDRPAVRLTAPERDGDRLDRFAGRTLRASDVRSARDGTRWAESGTADRRLWWRVGDGHRVVVGLGSGPWPDEDDADATLTVEYVRATTLPKNPDAPGDPARFADLAPISVSEALTTLMPPPEAPTTPDAPTPPPP